MISLTHVSCHHRIERYENVMHFPAIDAQFNIDMCSPNPAPIIIESYEQVLGGRARFVTSPTVALVANKTLQ